MASKRPAVIFDLDGTLVDSAADVAAILNVVLAVARVPIFTVAEVESLMGEGIERTITKALESRGHATSAEKVRKLHRRFAELYLETPVNATKAYPHAGKVLAELGQKGIAVGVCTNKAEAPARLILDRTGLLGHIKAVVGGDSGHGLKPAPGPLQACAHLLGADLPAITYVGDHAIDLAAGRAAGVRVILVTYGYMRAEAATLSAEHSIGCLSELQRALGLAE